MPRQAFTMIELLVVVAVIAILSSMVLMGASALRGDAKAKQTDAIIAAVQQGLDLFGANRGGAVAPAEHPLAGSYDRKYDFLRTKQGGGNSGIQMHWSSTSEPAVVGLWDMRQIDIQGFDGQQAYFETGRAYFPDDVFVDERAPQYMGLRRKYMGLLGTVQQSTTWYLKVSPPRAGDTVKLPNPTQEPGVWKQLSVPRTTNGTDLERGDDTWGTPAENKKLIDYVFGSSNAQAELAKLKAIHESLPDQGEFGHGLMTGYKNKPRLFGDRPEGQAGEAEWTPTRIKLPGDSSATAWRTVRMPGLAIYDAWGNPILYGINSQGRMTLMSPGRDGSYMIDPGPDGIFQTKRSAIEDSMMEPGHESNVPLQKFLVGDDRLGVKNNLTNTGLIDW